MALYPWHELQWQRLQRARAEGRLPHALMLAGIAGLGKAAFGELFARSLLCREPENDGQPCGRCRSCRFFSAGSHPDFLRVEPEAEGKPIRVEAVREFAAWSVMTPQEGEHRVTLIVPADSMNASAANSLLKTLEEPVAGNHILLVSSRPAALPATVRSRCQQIVFRAPPLPRAESWLRDEAGEGPWQLLLRLARNAPLEAMRLAGEDTLALRAEIFEEFCRLWSRRADPLALAAKWSEHDVRRLLGWVDSWLRDLVRLSLGGESATLENPDLLSGLQALGQSVDLNKVVSIQCEFESAASSWHQANLNTRMQLENLLIALVNSHR